jgi:protein gp37
MDRRHLERRQRLLGGLARLHQLLCDEAGAPLPRAPGPHAQSKGGMVWTGEVRFNEAVLLHPLRWRRPRKIFVCAHGDLFHEKVPDEWIDQVFAVMALAPQHVFQVLTKRPERMREYAYRGDGLRRALARARRALACPDVAAPERLARH